MNPVGLQSPESISVPRDSVADASHQCRHCGQLLFHGTVRDSAGVAFCCEGCKHVYALLAGMPWGDRFNSLLVQSGRRAPQAEPGEEYQSFLASLDDKVYLAEIGSRVGDLHALTLESRDITCAACGWLLENILSGMSGVKSLEVDFLHGEIFIRYDMRQVSLRSILTDLSAFGYRLKPKSDTSPVRPQPDRALLYRIAVSGACFANAMAFALANYAGLFQGIAAGWERFFGLMSFGFALIAVSYAAYPFYSGAWRVLRAGRFNIDVTVTLGILIALAATTASLAGGGAGNFSDSLAGLVFFLLVGRWGVRRFEAALALKGRWFEALRPGKVRLETKDGHILVESGEVKQGACIRVEAGEHVPMDGTLISPEAWVDSGLLTGESRPVHLKTGDSIFAGTVNLKNAVSMQVTSINGATRVAELGRKLEQLALHRRPVLDGAAKVARGFTLAVALLAALAFFLHLGQGWIRAASVAATVFIISCSCALALAVPICRGLGLKRARDLGFHFKSQAALESIRGTRCVLLDKTGTLTFTQRKVSAWNWLAPFDNGDGRELEALQAIKALARHSLHPVAVSLKRALESIQDQGVTLSQVREIENFGMSGRLRQARWSSICLCRNRAWEEAVGPFADLGYADPTQAGIGKIPSGDTCVFLDGKLAAVIVFTDEIKPDVPEMVKSMESAGVTVVLLSGDNGEKVASFAKACGIEKYHFGLTPEAKQLWAEKYHDAFGSTLAVGDGFNDSLLFGASDLAIAMQGGAVDLSPGTDILFTGTRLSALTRLFDLSGGVSAAVKLCYWVSGFYNAAAITAALFGLVTPLFAAVVMPISSLSICLAAWWRIPRGR